MGDPRGLPDPLLAFTDGASGLIRVVERCFPRAVRQRCLVHRLRNLHSKAPDSQWPEIDPGPRLLRGGLAGAGRAAARRLRPSLWPRPAGGGAVFRRRLPRLHGHLRFRCAIARWSGAPISWSGSSSRSALALGIVQGGVDDGRPEIFEHDPPRGRRRRNSKAARCRRSHVATSGRRRARRT